MPRCYSLRVLLTVVLGLCGVVFLLLTPRLVFAGQPLGVNPGETLSTNPKSRTAIVTATVGDNIPPSVPILVSPSNNALLSTNNFPFVWDESTDNSGYIRDYQLYLDGNLLYDNIGPGDNTTSSYVHTSLMGVSTLKPVGTIADGLHTWKVVAYDPYNNAASSATWSFTVDTTAPTIVVQKIGELSVSISSQDSSTVPTKPLIIYTNPATISGSTEASAKVQLSFTLPNGTTTNLSTIAAADGSFSFIMPTLPDNVVLYLNFVAQDAAGNTSTINQVPIEMKVKTIVLPPPLNQVIPPITVPQRTEIIQQTQQAIEKVVPPALVEQASGIADTVSPIANSLLGLIIPLLRLAIALHFTGVGISLVTVQLLRKIARALYLLPPEERLGLVYDVDTHKGVPYAVVKIYPVKDEENLHVELSREIKEFVTDADGLYGPVSLTPGQYTLEVTHADYTYLARETVSRNSDDETLYNGEIFVTDDAHRHVYFMVPMQSKERVVEASAFVASEDKRSTLGILSRKLAVSFTRLPTWVLLATTLLMGIVAFFYFTIWNVVMFLLYLYTLSKRAARKVKLPTLVGGVVDQYGDPMSLAYVRVVPKDNVHLKGVAMQADELGKFAFTLRPGSYRLQASWFDGSPTDWIDIELQKTATAIALSIQTGNLLDGAAATPATFLQQKIATLQAQA